LKTNLTEVVEIKAQNISNNALKEESFINEKNIQKTTSASDLE